MSSRRAGFTDEDDRMAKLLMAEFERVEHRPVTASWVATFADLARAVRLDQQARWARVEALIDQWESDRDVCLAWIDNPEMHVDPDHPRRLSDLADRLNRAVEALRAATTPTPVAPATDTTGAGA